VFRSVHPSTKVPLALQSSVPGDMFTTRQVAYLDGEPYFSGPTSSKYYLRDVVGSNHAPIKTPCLAGVDASTAYCDIGLFDLSGDFEYSFWLKYEGSASTAIGTMIVGGGLSGGGSTYQSFLWYRPSTGTWTLAANGQATRLTVVDSTVEDNKWHHIKITRVGGLYTMYLDFISIGSATAAVTLFSTRSILMTFGSSYSLHGLMADFRITHGGVTTHFPLQEGNGRDIAWYASNGTYGVRSNALINGTVADLWAAQCPGYAEDWCIKYGGRIGSGGGFIGGVPSQSYCADDEAKDFVAGKHGNPYTSINFNPNWTQTYLDRSIPNTFKAGQDINGQVIPAESAFCRSSADGDDRIIIYSSSRTGDILDAVRLYTGTSAPTSWSLDDLPAETADLYFDAITANSGTISSDNQDAVLNLLQGLYDADLYREVLALYLYHGNHLNAARLNAINPGNHSGTWNIVWVGTPTLNASGGITPSAGNYGKAFHPDSMGLSYRSGAGLGFYSTSNAATSEYTMGHFAANNLFYLAPKQGGASRLAVGGYEVTGTAQDLSGFHFGSREPNSNVQAAYRNATQYINNATQSWPLTVYATSSTLARVGGATGASPDSTTPIRLSLVTSGMLSSQVTDLNTLVQAYISELV